LTGARDECGEHDPAALARVDRHGTIELRIELEPAALQIAVSDQGEVLLPPNPTPGAHGGWGLRIVEELADDWGVKDGSTKVWFRLDQSRAKR
jgi:anti-sigma regulatory factor (Ser/Thr protein kinase)